MNETMVFDDITLRQVPVRLGQDQYVLVEASEEVACRYRQAVMRGSRFDASGEFAGVTEGMAEVPALLVSLCLYRADGEGRLRLRADGVPDPAYRVGLEQVRALRQQTVTAMFRRCKEISELDQVERADGVEDLERQAGEIQRRLEVARVGGAAKNGLGAATNTTAQPTPSGSV